MSARSTGPVFTEVRDCPGGILDIEFFLPIVPPTVTAQQKGVAVRGGKPRFYTKDAVRDAAATFISWLLAARRGMDPADEARLPLKGAVMLIVEWSFHFPASKPGLCNKLKPTRPDVDNLQKLFKDCLTRAGFWRDDAQVAVETASKWYRARPGIRVIIRAEADCNARKP